MFKVPQDIQDNFLIAIQQETLIDFKWKRCATQFLIGNSTVYIVNDVIGREVFIESRRQLNGSELWVVKMDAWVLGKDSKYHFEPTPSSRTDEFIKNTRFNSKASALASLINHENKYKNNRPQLYLL